ncbi:MAG: O-acetyl-ADP-ribose deacetylase [Planctomycetota bacterium]
MKTIVGKAVLELVEGDVTREEVDAIVNAANSGLRGGGGVDGAIHRAGGPSIMEECRRIGGCPTGDAVLTGAGDLPAKKVIHAVGPIYTGSPRDPELLASAYRRSLEVASANNLASVAFPSLSTGAYRYPMPEAAKVALSTVIEYLRDHGEIETVRFVLFGAEAYRTYEKTLRELVRPQ